MKNIYKIGILIMTIIMVGCDKDEFAELNSNPSTLSSPELRYSVAKSVEQMFGNDYTVWFYNNFDYVFPWSQLTGVGVGNGEQFVEMGDAGDQYYNFYKGVFPNTRDIRANIDNMSGEDKAKYQAMRALTFAIQIQPAISLSDTRGSIVYSEAAMAPYTTPALITPVYDNQEMLFDLWLTELDEAIMALSTVDQISLENQDLIYGGNYEKWAKYCNLLKLKIAARLVNTNRAKAIQIAEEVAGSPVGYMDDLSEDFIYRRDVNYYGTGDGTQPGTGGKNIIDFLVDNKDPRARFLFKKNSFNAEIVQTFLEQGKALPPYVEQFVNLDVDGNFDSWAGPGEPWVRYFGAPLSPDAEFDSNNDSYFRQSELNKISIDGVEKIYSSTSSYQEKITRTGINFTYPTKPGGRVIEKKDNHPAIQVILGSSAEANLYLAEFKMLGANLPASAQDYFNRGVELSVLRMDALAANNQMPYYESDPVYTDENDAEQASTKLKAGEISALLALPAYDLSIDGLEKVYIQQYVNFAATPGDLWTLVRRSGVPKTGSSVLPREPFLASGSELTVPRRFTVGTPTADSKNFENQNAAADEQGFTTGTNSPSILNSERLWFDIQNPTYGAGPKQ